MIGRHYQHGVALFNLRRYREAVDAFSEELGENPDSALALAMRAASWINAGKTRNAYRDVTEALGMDPGLAYAHYILSIVRGKQARPRLAEASILEALRIEPRTNYFHGLAEIHFHRGRIRDALAALEKGLAIFAWDPNSLLLQAKCLSTLGQHEVAKKNLLAVLSRNPENPAAHQALGKLTLATGHSEEARDSLREARRLNPIVHNDREALAAAYGRMLWPLRILNRHLLRVHMWTPIRRWTFLAIITSALIVLAILCQPWPYFTVPIFLAVFNVFAAPASINEFAIPLGMAAFRRDLDIRWYRVLPQGLRLFFALSIHLGASLLAVAAAVFPPIAILILGLIQHCELILVWIRKRRFLHQTPFLLIAVFGVFTPLFTAMIVSVETPKLIVLAYWAVALLVSFLLNEYGR